MPGRLPSLPAKEPALHDWSVTTQEAIILYAAFVPESQLIWEGSFSCFASGESESVG